MDDLKKKNFYNICKDYFSIQSEIKSSNHQILGFLEWFDSLGPISTVAIDAGADVGISLIDESIQNLISQCNLSPSILRENNSALWYELNALRNSARSDLHAENSLKRIEQVCKSAESYSIEYDILSTNFYNYLSYSISYVT